MKKTIKDLNIFIEGRYCHVTDKDGKCIYEGSIEEGMTHEDVYKNLTAMCEFRLNGKVLSSYSLYGTFPGEKEAVLESLAYDYNCDVKDKEVRIVTENI